MALVRFTFREVAQRPMRAILTLLSIVIGVAAIVAVSIATQTTNRAHLVVFETITGKAGLEVTAEDSLPFDQGLVEQLDGTPGLAAVVPVLEDKVAVYAHGRDERGIDTQVIGIDPARHDAVNDFEIVEGEKLTTANGVVLSTSLAEGLAVAVGNEVVIAHVNQSKPWIKKPEPVVGTFKPHRASVISILPVVLMPLEQAQERLLKVGSGSRRLITRVLLVLEEGASESAVQNAVAAKLPTGLTVRRPPTRNQMADETSLGVKQATNMSLAFALLVAVFVIMNTFMMNVSERAKQLATLRALGATRWQIGRLIAREALVIGVLGAAGGVALGIPLARLLIRGTERLMDTSMPEMRLSWLPLLIAGLVGVSVAALGALAPVIRTFRISPREGIQGLSPDRARGAIAWSLPAALALLIGAVGVYLLCLKAWLPMHFGLLSALMALVGLVMLLPQVLSFVTRVLTWGVPRKQRVEAVLAQRQLVRNLGRSTLTIGVLFIAASTGVGLANTILDNVYTIQNWYRKTVVGDFFVGISDLGIDDGKVVALNERVGQDISAIPGVTAIDPLTWINNVKIHNQGVTVIVRDFPSDDHVNFDTRDGDAATLRQRLLAGDVVIGEVFAQRAGLKAGDELSMKTQRGEFTLPVAAVTNEYRSGGLAVYLHRPTAERVLGDRGRVVNEYIVRTDPAARDDVKAALTAVCRKYEKDGLVLNSLTDITSRIDRMINGVLAGLWVLLVLGFVVASFGLANTLTMNVLEQTRELALLRVVAMTRHQVRKLIFAQAVLMGAVSLLPALAAGVGVAYMINLLTLPVTGHAIPFSLHPVMMALVFVAAYLMVVAVAWLPAERAARLSTSACLHYE
jgi:putative ABC transport system permease protein